MFCIFKKKETSNIIHEIPRIREIIKKDYSLFKVIIRRDRLGKILKKKIETMV